ncbi:Glycosyltransferase involved in cell wall bisynthesis [Pseudomonas delhiensis]|uniref:Glycosyltransferase involved in cell wall bisynthesis n=1 Tax=Pseudomonas delhiensis TaxID=366289 RepID=A0A239IQQ0_9PSED|nr:MULTISPECIES: glycosyltransferase [Pseudomonas]SDI66005.1 Glycosyltransferase involved in cell wall bisynthesis [Pseudomonas delhiensis]SNS95538.1 Glycosyltransferase involved in cell wall bisynthesis [Pseudomonas delhiensis]
MKVAIVHYWWLSNRGGEAVCSAIAEIYPEADIFIHVCDEDLVRKTLPSNFKGQIKTTFISRLPGARKHYQKYLPLMPLALEQLNLTEYDLIISSESGPAKGVITRPDALHVCYCHSPMRYVWDMYHEYLSGTGRLIRMLFPAIAHWLRMWDKLSADRVDHFIANSRFVASRIQKFYRRQAEVIYPPVNVSEFSYSEERGDFYLCLGQLVAYKRADLAVEAFNKLGLPLIVVGEGELFNTLKEIANSNITLMGRQSFPIIKDLLQRCRGLVFPGLEDFGIVPVEAMAAGAPVIAYGKGGALDTVVHGKTGVLFHEQSIDALVQAVRQFEAGNFEFASAELHQHAKTFEKRKFQQRVKDFIDKALATT